MVQKKEKKKYLVFCSQRIKLIFWNGFSYFGNCNKLNYFLYYCWINHRGTFRGKTPLLLHIWSLNNKVCVWFFHQERRKQERLWQPGGWRHWWKSYLHVIILRRSYWPSERRPHPQVWRHKHFHLHKKLLSTDC